LVLLNLIDVPGFIIGAALINCEVVPGLSIISFVEGSPEKLATYVRIVEIENFYSTPALLTG